MLMVLLIAIGAMHLGWMLTIAMVILLEKVAPFGEWVARATAAMLVLLGTALLIDPAFLVHFV